MASQVFHKGFASVEMKHMKHFLVSNHVAMKAYYIHLTDLCHSIFCSIFLWHAMAYLLLATEAVLTMQVNAVFSYMKYLKLLKSVRHTQCFGLARRLWPCVQECVPLFHVCSVKGLLLLSASL